MDAEPSAGAGLGELLPDAAVSMRFDSSTGAEVIVGRGCFQHWHMLHDRYAFSFLEDIHTVSQYRHQTFEHHPNTMAVMEPGEIHRVTKVGGHGDFSTIFVPLAVVAEHLGRREPHFSTAPHAVLDVVSVREYLQLLETSSSRLEREEALMGVLEAADATFGEQRARRIPRMSRPVARCCELLHARMTDDMSLDDLARAADLGKPSLVRAFKREISLTPMAYLMHLRVNHARRRLADGVATLEVALESGFCDQSHLTRWFKKVLAVTPGSYVTAVRGPSHLLARHP